MTGSIEDILGKLSEGKSLSIDDVNVLKSGHANLQQMLEASRHAIEGLTHDTRHSLNIISGLVSTVLNMSPEHMSGEAKRQLKDASIIVGNAIGFAENHLRLAQISYGELASMEFDLGSMAREVISALLYTAPERKIDLNITDGMIVNADEGLMRIAMQNLLGNAFKYTGYIP